MTASSNDRNIVSREEPRRCARLVASLEELAGEPQDPRPVTPLQIPRVDRQDGDSALRGPEQVPEPMSDVTEPAPATTVPGPGREGDRRACPRLEGEEAQDLLEPEATLLSHPHVPPLPGRREEGPGRLSEDVREDPLSALENASSSVGIQAVHLVAALGEPRGRSRASLASMEVAVEEE